MMYIHSQCRSDRIEPDVSRPQGCLTNINNNMSFSHRVLSSGRSRGTDLLSILSDTFAYPNPPHKPEGIYEFITLRGESGEEPENNLSKKLWGTRGYRGTQRRFPPECIEVILGYPFIDLWEMHSKWRYKICICSVILGELEALRNYKGIRVIFPKIL